MASTRAADHRKHAVQAAIVMGLLLPGMLLLALDFNPAMALFAYAVMVGFLVALLLDTRLAVVMVAALTAANMIAYAAAPWPPLAALVMTVSVLLYGLTARRGVSGYIVMAPISVAFTLAQPPTVLPDSSVVANMLVLGLVAIVAGIWGVAAGTLLGRQVPTPPHSDLDWRTTWLFAGILAVVCGIVMAVVRTVDLQQNGAWILLTVLIVTQPGRRTTWQKVRDRLLGTFAGFAIALVVALPLNGHPAALTLVAIGLFAIAVFVMLSRQPYWLFVTFLTPGVVLIVGAETDIAMTDIARVWSTVVGAAIAVAILGILRMVGVNDPDDAPRPSGASA